MAQNNVNKKDLTKALNDMAFYRERMAAIQPTKKAKQNKYGNVGMDDLINVVAKLNQDVKQIRDAQSVVSANEWINRHGYNDLYEATGKDLDGDGIPEVVVQTKEGKKPVIVNGFTTVPSLFPYRNAYYKTYPTVDQRKEAHKQGINLRGFINNIYHPESYQNLINKCWESNASNRPTFDEIVDELRGNEGFITETIDEVEFYNYIDYINEYESSFSSGKSILSIDEFMKKRKKKSMKPRTKAIKPSIFEKVSVNTDENKEKSYNTQNLKDNDELESFLKRIYAFLNNHNINNVKKEEVIEYYKKQADNGDTLGMLACTLLIQSTDIEKSAYYCKMAADNGELTAMHYNHAENSQKCLGISNPIPTHCSLIEKVEYIFIHLFLLLWVLGM